jgi:chromosome segregation ATPase
MDQFEIRLSAAERQLADALARITDLENRIRSLEQQNQEVRGGV